MEFQFDKKVVLITGASGGIGRATALLFAKYGARVAVHYQKNLMAAEETLTLMDGDKHRTVCFDLQDPDQIRNGVEEVLDNFERIDVLINNAGIYFHHPLVNFSFDEWEKSWDAIIKTNLLGPAHLSYWCLQPMINQGGGKIINVSSRGAFRGEPKAPAYGASKAGLNSLTVSLARAMAPYKIYVYGVAPGFVETEMAAPYLNGPEGDSIRSQSPMGRVAYPEEVAQTICFLASEGTDHLTGSVIDINGASYPRI